VRSERRTQFDELNERDCSIDFYIEMTREL
jgi:hypothetical protein